MKQLVNIIHSTDRYDRYKLLVHEANEQGYDFRLWEGIKSQDKPAVNISKAHRRIVKFAKDTNLEEIIILEDDIKWCCKGAFDYFINNKPKLFDLYLATISWGRVLPDNMVLDFSGLMGYIIHNKYYNTFLSSDTKLDIDRAQARRGQFYVCNPFAAIQYETFSDNTKRIHLNDKLFKNRNLYNGQ